MLEKEGRTLLLSSARRKVGKEKASRKRLAQGDILLEEARLVTFAGMDGFLWHVGKKKDFHGYTSHQDI